MEHAPPAGAHAEAGGEQQEFFFRARGGLRLGGGVRDSCRPETWLASDKLCQLNQDAVCAGEAGEALHVPSPIICCFRMPSCGNVLRVKQLEGNSEAEPGH